MRLVRPSLVCDRVREQISIGLDGELSQLERAMLSSHLDRCGDCRAYEADVTAFTQALRTAPLEPLGRPIAVKSRRRQFITTRVQVGAAAAVALAALIGSGELLKGKQLEIQDVFVPAKTKVEFPTRQQLEREQAILERAQVGRPVQLDGQVL